MIYLKNKDLLEEIHKSKTSYSSFTESKYSTYHAIVSDMDEITYILLNQLKKQQSIELNVDISTIKNSDIVFRVMTNKHIPTYIHKRKTGEVLKKRKVNFPPFTHYIINDFGVLECVGKSHWVGSLTEGEFSIKHGRVTEKLGSMYIELCRRYATKHIVRSYSYNDEMKSQALLQLTFAGLQFDESKSNTPFPYLTTITHNAFIKVMNSEKRSQSLRDDLLEYHGLEPSSTRQNEEYFAKFNRD